MENVIVIGVEIICHLIFIVRIGRKEHMKTSKWYLVLIIIDVLLLIGWPISLLCLGPGFPNFLAFLIGVVWFSDFIDLKSHIVKYKEHKFYEGFKEI